VAGASGRVEALGARRLMLIVKTKREGFNQNQILKFLSSFATKRYLKKNFMTAV